MEPLHPFAGECPRCKAHAWDFISEHRRGAAKPQDVIGCAFCGARLRVPSAGPRPDATAAADWAFPSGRFAGKTPREVAAEPSGMRYLEVMLSNESARPHVQAFLSGLDSERRVETIVPEIDPCLSKHPSPLRSEERQPPRDGGA